jgi:hypothetical protein
VPGPHHHHIKLFRKRHTLHFTCEYRHRRGEGSSSSPCLSSQAETSSPFAQASLK